MTSTVATPTTPTTPDVWRVSVAEDGNPPNVGGGSLAFARVVVGALGAITCGRFLLRGWVTAFWVEPEHHFTWPGLWWVRPLPSGWMHAFVTLVGALFLAAGWRAARGRSSRVPMMVAAAGFTYLGAIDIAPYLNHYVLLVLLAVVLAVLPEGREVPAWSPAPVRVVVATTYVWAAVAKLDADWLSGRTIRPWLATHTDWPVVGELFRWGWFAQLLAIAGLAFDALIVPLLLWRRTRGAAYVAVVAFHLATAALFPIGIFPWLMIGATTVFFAPGWCARWIDGAADGRAALVPRRALLVVLGVLAVVPARGYASDVAWSEYGGRFAWRVMATNKVGVAELWVVPAGSDPADAYAVQPARDLSPLQAQQVAWQPDLVLQWAHLVADLERERLGRDVAVFADVWVSINGSEPRQLIDPTVDLAQERWSPLRPAWVLPDPH